jgi:hypothetical protein
VGNGRISLLLDSPLSNMLAALRAVPADVRKQITTYTRTTAEPIWKQEMAARGTTRLQQKALVSSARVGVATRNVYLRSGSVGKLGSGTPVSVIANPAEYGANPNRPVYQHSKKGKRYKRRLGNAFGAPRRGGNVFNPAARESIPRIASVIIQTARRTLFDALDGKR